MKRKSAIPAADRKTMRVDKYEYLERIDNHGGLLRSRWHEPMVWSDFHTPRTTTPIRLANNDPYFT